MESDKRTSTKQTLTSQYDGQYLGMKVADLRQKLDSLGRTNASVQPEINEIRQSLDRAETEPASRVRWNFYQLSYRHYTRICPPRRVSTSLRQVLTEFIESFHLTSRVC